MRPNSVISADRPSGVVSTKSEHDYLLRASAISSSFPESYVSSLMLSLML